MRVLFLLLVLSGCAVVRILPLRAPPAVVVSPVTCGDVTALAAAIVDGRRRGQSRVEQRLFVVPGGPASALHRGMVESIYDWPRPISPAGWARLTEVAVTAASAHCLNRPAAALRGVIYR